MTKLGHKKGGSTTSLESQLLNVDYHVVFLSSPSGESPFLYVVVARVFVCLQSTTCDVYKFLRINFCKLCISSKI